jgi:hypothetical protein
VQDATLIETTKVAAPRPQGKEREVHHEKLAAMSSMYMIKWVVFLQFLEMRERNCGGSSFWILCNGRITDQRR